MAPTTRKYKFNQKMYAEGDIYLGDHLTRSWTRDERGTAKQAASPVVSEPGNNVMSTTPSAYQIKHSQTPIPHTRSSLREPRGSRRHWASKNVIQNVTPEELQKWKQSFDNLLRSPIGSRLFRLFLESEIAEENFLFWEACEELKQMKKEKRMQKLIQNIFDDYISVYSPREINIDYKMREDIVEQLRLSNAADPNVFREAQMQIYRLMHRDSYPRFLASAQSVQEKMADYKRKGSKQQHRESETKLKSRFNTNVLCCYGNDPDDPESAGQFIPMEDHEFKVEESPKSPANGRTTPNKPTVEHDPDKQTEDEHSEQAATLTSLANTVNPLQQIEADITPPGAVDPPRKLSDSSSKRESGIDLISSSTRGEDDVTVRRSADVIKVEVDVTPGVVESSTVEVPEDVVDVQNFTNDVTKNDVDITKCQSDVTEEVSDVTSIIGNESSDATEQKHEETQVLQTPEMTSFSRTDGIQT